MPVLRPASAHHPAQNRCRVSARSMPESGEQRERSNIQRYCIKLKRCFTKSEVHGRKKPTLHSLFSLGGEDHSKNKSKQENITKLRLVCASCRDPIPPSHSVFHIDFGTRVVSFLSLFFKLV